MSSIVKALINKIGTWNVEKIEAFYIYLECYWEGFVGLRNSPYPQTHSRPYSGFMYKQLELRGCNQYIEEFKGLCNAYLQNYEEIRTLKCYIAEKYKNDLANLIRERLNNLSEDEKQVLEYFVGWCYSRNEYSRIKDPDSFKYYIPINDKDKGEEFLIKKGLLILDGYYSVGVRHYDHVWYEIPPWIEPIIKEIYRKSSEIQKEDEDLLRKLEEGKVIMGSCTICNTDVLRSEMHRRVFGKYFHEQCLKNEVGILPMFLAEESLGRLFERLKIIPGKY